MKIIRNFKLKEVNKPFKKVLRVKQTHPLFKMRAVKQRFAYSSTIWENTEYMCPACKRWFTSYSTYNTMGLRLHITRTARIEAVAKQLRELKKTPHFELWEKNTEPINALHKPREWKFS